MNFFDSLLVFIRFLGILRLKIFRSKCCDTFFCKFTQFMYATRTANELGESLSWLNDYIYVLLWWWLRGVGVSSNGVIKCARACVTLRLIWHLTLRYCAQMFETATTVIAFLYKGMCLSMLLRFITSIDWIVLKSAFVSSILHLRIEF